MKPEELLATLADIGLVSDEVLSQLRRKVDKSPAKYDSQKLVQMLIDNGHLTSTQARRLFPTVPISNAPTSHDLPEKVGAGATPRAQEELGFASDIRRHSDLAEDDDDLVPLDDDPPTARMPTSTAGTRPAVGPARGKAPGKLELADEQPAQGNGGGSPRGKSAKPASKGGSADAKSARRRPAWRDEKKQAPAVAPAPATPVRGPLDDLFGSATSTAAGLAEGNALAPPEKKKRGLFAKRDPNEKRDVTKYDWGSKLIMIVSVLVILLVIAAGVLFFLLTRRSGDEALASADADYNSGSYSQAKHKFDEFLKNHPGHSGASQSRVRKGLCELRLAIDNAKDWSKAFQVCKKVVKEISSEEKFVEAQADLAGMLPKIAEGLSLQAASEQSEKLIKECRECLALIAKYVPKKITPLDKLAEIEKSLDLTARDLVKGESLSVALKEIRQAISKGQVQQGYDVHKALVKNYPYLAVNSKLREALHELTAAEQKLVQVDATPRPPLTDEVETSVTATGAVANQTVTGTAVGVDGYVIYTIAGGAAYGLDAVTGKALWRRPVGMDSVFPPLAVSPDAGSDCILVDTTRHEVLRVGGKDGALRWRFPLGGPCGAAPILVRGNLLVPTRAGQIFKIDVESGTCQAVIQLPQALRVSTAVGSSGKLYYQLGDHSNLYVLDAETNQCLEVIYAGHEPDSVLVPPLVVGRYIFLADNNSANNSLLRILLTDLKGLNASPLPPMPLQGHVFVPPQVSGRTMFVATDRGGLYSFEMVAPSDNPEESISEVLVKVAEKPADDVAPLVRYYLMRDSRLWLAGKDLTKYDIESARGKLSPKWMKNEGDSFLQSPQAIGGVVFHARTKGTLPGVAVAAITADTGDPIWETHLAAPPAGAMIVDPEGSRVAVLSGAGALYEASVDELQGAKILPSASASSMYGGFAQASHPTALENERLAFVAGGDRKRILIVEPAGSAVRLRWMDQPDALASSTLALASGVLTLSDVGQVLVVNPNDGTTLVAPFQPRLEGGRQFHWGSPIRVGENDVLVCDGLSTLYRLSIAQQPRPHLMEAARAQLTQPIVSPLAVDAGIAHGVDGNGRLLMFQLPDLAQIGEHELGSAPTWGPIAVGGQVLVATLGDELLAFSNGKLVWKTSLKFGPLAGEPLLVQGELLLATQAGIVERVNSASGKIVGQVDLGQPLAAGPFPWKDHLLLVAHDGSLLVSARP